MHVVLTYLSAINDQDTCMYQQKACLFRGDITDASVKKDKNTAAPCCFKASENRL